MQHSITIANTVTMTSLELVELVNEARAEFGESHVRHNDFVALCKNELDGEYYDVVVVKNQNGTTSEAIRMTQDQCKRMAMRGSKGVRRRLLARLDALEAARAAPALALPDFTNPDISDSSLGALIDQRRSLSAQLAGVELQIAMFVGDRDAAQRALREMNAQVGARHAARAVACQEGVSV